MRWLVLCLTLAGCSREERNGRALAIAVTELNAAREALARTRGELAECRRQPGGAAAAIAPPEARTNPVAPLQLAAVAVEHRRDSLRARFRVTNLGEVRARGSLCLRLYAADGAEIEHLLATERSLAPKATQELMLDAPLDRAAWDETTTLRAYLAPFGCADLAADAASNVLSLDRTHLPR